MPTQGPNCACAACVAQRTQHTITSSYSTQKTDAGAEDGTRARHQSEFRQRGSCVAGRPRSTARILQLFKPGRLAPCKWSKLCSVGHYVKGENCVMRILTLAAVVALATATTASAQVTSSVPLGDEYFAMRAYAEGLAEISMSQLAISRATQQNIREFAVRMVRDHTKCNNDIVELARQKGIARAGDPRCRE